MDSIKTVVLLRAGAPDKAMMSGNGTFKYEKYNGLNMADLSNEEIKEILGKDWYILSADEGDILKANKLPGDQSHILLPQIVNEGVTRVIDYESFVPKNSNVYNYLEEYTDVKYMHYDQYEIEDVEEYAKNNSERPVYQQCAIKTTTGSGSRGIFIANKDAFNQGLFNYHEYATKDDVFRITNFARKERDEGRDCKILIQDLIPIDLLKVNVDFVIKNDKMLGYGWELPEHGSNFTNWNWFTMIRNEKTDYWMNKISDYLINYWGIKNAIMNFEAYCSKDMSELYMVEFNWRYSNSTFGTKAFGVDVIDCYLNDKNFVMPNGENRVLRYWQAITETNIGFARNGK